MRSPRTWLLVICVVAIVVAIRPTGELLIRSEVLRHTGSRLTMDRLQFNMLSGGIAVEGATIEVGSYLNQNESSPQTTIKIAKIWSKGSLNKLLYRKLSAPVTVMDGVAVELSKADESQVPAVQPITQLVRDNTLLLAPQQNAFSDELDQAFRNTQDALNKDRSAFRQIETQLTAIEQRSLRLDNPLRDRELLLASQQSVTSLERELEQARDSLNQHRESFRQSSLTMPRSRSEGLALSPGNKKLVSTEELADIKTQARSLAEHLVCATVTRMKPYLGLSSSVTRHCLIDKSLRESQSSFRSSLKQSVATRGLNYGFGSMNENNILFGSIRLRGQATIDDKQLPFKGQMKNIGSQSLQAEARPSLNLTFTTLDKHNLDETPTVTLMSTVIPDRQGYKIQGQMVPAGTMITSAAQGDWKLAAFGQNTTINLEWLVHQSEWSLTIDIRSSQTEVVVKRNALLSAPVKSDMMPRYESCFSSTGPVTLAKAQFQGDLQEGVPCQRSLRFESPILEGLAESMLEQQRMIFDVSSTTDQQTMEAAFAQSISSYQNTIEGSHREIIAVHEKLRVRLQGFNSKLAEVLPSRDDLRVSREDSEGILR